ncbi:hypothetical protein [Corynebacterium efficiens YS-314]|uniref:Uncharacterized protein n=1 Tax=Corynebacterium efficiens (strain DSM 44549 / YS-314 / AJ 12310 / JCM 11189 / NBRC 100395) TaxID=196164 RepID=Q8FMI1_COREF|nr:hypothetical protein [Corynebacterium efficiens YS-314]
MRWKGAVAFLLCGCPFSRDVPNWKYKTISMEFVCELRGSRLGVRFLSVKKFKLRTAYLSGIVAISLVFGQAQPVAAQPIPEVSSSAVDGVSAPSIVPRIENGTLVIAGNRIPLAHLGFAAGAIAALVAALSGLGGSSGRSSTPEADPPEEEPDWLPSRPLENRAVPKEDTVIAEPGAVLHVSAGVDHPKIVLMNPEIMTAPDVGEILVVNVTASTPIGVVGRVTRSVVLDNGLVELTVEAVSLEDAYDDFSFDVDFTLRDAIIYDAGDVAANALRLFARAAASPSTMNISPTQSMWECESKAQPRVEMGSVMELTGKAQFDLWDRYAKVEIEQKNELYLQILGALEEECELGEHILPRVWIPIWGPLGLELGPEVTIALSATGGATFSVATETTVGAIFDGNQSKPIFEHKNEPFAPAMEANVAADVFVGIKGALKGEIGVADAGLFVEGGPGVSAEATVSSTLEDNCIEAYLYGVLNAGIEAEVSMLWDWEAKLPGTTIAKFSIYEHCVEVDNPDGGSGEVSQPTRPLPPVGEFYTRPGELTNLTISPQLATRIDSVEDGRSVYFQNFWAGTNLFVGGRSYGVAADWINKENGFEVVSGPVITGTGSAWDPFVVKTSVRAGDSGLLIEQLDVFEDLNGRYHTAISVTNTSENAHDFVLYRGADCYLNRDDYGTGEVFDGGASCVASDGRRITLTDNSGDVRAAAGRYLDIWRTIVDGSEFNDTAAPGRYDNGMGISWSRTVNSGETLSFISTFQLEEPAGR